MRLNRNSLIFVGVISLVIIAILIFQMTDTGLGTTPTPTPASPIVSIFPLAAPTSITSLSISSQIELGDTRPTPIPGNPPLPTLTPLPLGAEGPAETKSIVLQYDPTTLTWSLGQGGTVTSTSPIMQQTVTTALTTLASLRSSQSIADQAANLAQFGLDTPNHVIVFAVTEASVDSAGQPVVTPVTHTLRLGNKSVDGSQYFALLDDDPATVYVIMGASALESSVLRLVTQPPFTPAPTATPAPVLNVPGYPFISFNYNLAASFTVTDHANGHSVSLVKQADDITWAVLDSASSQLVVTPEVTAEATAESTAEATAEVTAEATLAIVPTTTGPAVDQLGVAIYLTEFNNVSAVLRANTADLTALGLTSPHYTIEAIMSDGTRYTLRLGNTDPTNTLYYALVNTFPDAILVDAVTVAPLLDLLSNPPYVTEVTPEVTVAPLEVTAEATAPARLVEVTPEVTAEATQE